MDEAAALLQQYVERHNLGVRTGSFAKLAELFSPTLQMTFDGLPMGPFVGRTAVIAAFEERPPTDELCVGDIISQSDVAQTTYAWARDADVIEGTIELRAKEGLIDVLRIVSRAG